VLLITIISQFIWNDIRYDIIYMLLKSMVSSCWT